MLKIITDFIGKITVAVVVVVLAWTTYWWLRKKPAPERLRRVQPLVDVIFRLWLRARRRIERSLAQVRPDLPAEELTRLARQIAHTVGANAAYLLGAEYESADDVRSRLRIGPGVIALLERYRRGKPSVVVFGHFLPFDGALGITEILGIEAAIVVEKMPWLVRPLFNRARQSWKGVNLVPIQRGRTYSAVEQRLQEGQLAVIALDIFRQPGQEKSVDVQVGNATVGVSTMPVSLAHNNGAMIFTLTTEWDPVAQIMFLEATPFEEPLTDVRVATGRLGRWIGERVREQTGHWMRPVWQELPAA